MKTDKDICVEMLEGTYLDTAVLVALGLQDVSNNGNTAYALLPDGSPAVIVGDPAESPLLHSFCRDWRLGGKLIEACHITIEFRDGTWNGRFREMESWGGTPLVAAMRALVKYSFQKNECLHDPEDATLLEALQMIFTLPEKSPKGEK